MKLQLHLRGLPFLFALTLLCVGCLKGDFGDIDDYEGTWEVASFRIETFDAAGNLVSDVTTKDYKDIDVNKDADKGNFNYLYYDPNLAFSPMTLLNYSGGGTTTTDGRNAVYCSPDLKDNRIHFWGYTVYGYYTYAATIDKKTRKELVWTYATLFPQGYLNVTTPTLHYLETLTLKKK